MSSAFILQQKILTWPNSCASSYCEAQGFM